MAEDYFPPPIEVDPGALTQLMFEVWERFHPDWTPSPGNPEVIQMEAVGEITAELMEVVSDVPPAIFRVSGAKVDRILPRDAVYATATATITMVDDAGYTIPEDAQLALEAADGDFLGAQVSLPLVIPPGSTTGVVVFSLVEPGVAGNELDGAVQITDALGLYEAQVASLTVVGKTSGGRDAETDEAYLDRLTRRRRKATDTPILPGEFADTATDDDDPATAVAHRALALDLYNPATGTFTNDGYVTVVAVDRAGEPLTGTQKAAIRAVLESRRQAGFECPVIDPSYTAVAVTVDVRARPGWAVETAEAQVVDALATYLSPAAWGAPRVEDRSPWVNETTVRLYELAEVVNRVEGVDYIVDGSLAAGVQGGALVAADLALAGVAPLPRTGTLTVTATPA